MKKLSFLFLLILAIMKLQAQDYLINFAGSGVSTKVDSVKVENLTQGTSLNKLGSEKPRYDSICWWKEWKFNGWKLNIKEYDFGYDANNNLTHYQGRDYSYDEIYQNITTYDERNNMISNLHQHGDKSNFWNIALRTYTYDINNNLTSFLRQDWNGNEWKISLSQAINQETLKYDANNNLTSRIYQDASGFWKETYTYDSNNNKASYLKQRMIDGEELENFEMKTYTYDSNNKILSEYYQSDWHWCGDNNVNSCWRYSELNSYTYENNNLKSKIVQQTTNSGFKNWSKTVFTYDINNNCTSEIFQLWSYDDWSNVTLWSYSYDTKNNKTRIMRQFFDDHDSLGRADFLNTYTYDANNNQTSDIMLTCYDSIFKRQNQKITIYDDNSNLISVSITHYWDDTNRERVTSGDSTYYYLHTGATGIKDIEEQYESITVYPNPNNGKFTIKSNDSINSIEIFNLQGGKINSKLIINQETSTEIDLPNQFKGTYMLKINNGNKIQTKKIMVY